MPSLNSKRFEELFKGLMEIGPPLPGNISKQYNICGKAGCRCKDENNPRPHGPRNLLSYTLNGKSSSLSVKSKEVAEACRMNGNHKKLRSVLNELSEESVALCRELGVSEAERHMSQAINRAKTTLDGSGSRQKPPPYLLRSRDNWKQKALQRQDRLEKNRIRINVRG